MPEAPARTAALSRAQRKIWVSLSPASVPLQLVESHFHDAHIMYYYTPIIHWQSLSLRIIPTFDTEELRKLDIQYIVVESDPSRRAAE
jgi:hypothetical protein